MSNTEKKMTTPVIKATAKADVLDFLRPTLIEMNAEFVGNMAYIPVTYDDVEVWVEVKLTTKNWYDSKSSTGNVIKGFDVFEKQKEYEEEQEIKRIEAEAKAKAKADKEKQKAAKSRKKSDTTETKEG